MLRHWLSLFWSWKNYTYRLKLNLVHCKGTWYRLLIYLILKRLIIAGFLWVYRSPATLRCVCNMISYKNLSYHMYRVPCYNFTTWIRILEKFYFTLLPFLLIVDNGIHWYVKVSWNPVVPHDQVVSINHVLNICLCLHHCRHLTYIFTSYS